MATIDPRRHDTLMYMNIAAAQVAPEKSAEEFRIDDYIKAYSTTGRPPAPCPPLPSGERERIALGLPPLFRPTPVKATDEDSNTAANGPADGSSLPATQLYHTLASNPGGDVWHTITVQSEYSNYSHEELRHYAYKNGHKFPPTPIAPHLMHPFTVPSTSSLHQSRPTPPPPITTNLNLSHTSNSDSPAAAFNRINGPSGTPEHLLTISSSPRYSKHSLEELRVSYLALGRELTSAEIMQIAQGGPLPTSSSSISGSGSGVPLAPSGSNASSIFSHSGGGGASRNTVRPF
ncbi:hypothetical protein PLICRDRAFT_693684 [Plicaturopsis crispa FD-325 SS-3]|nr:hypothetical protein PLICRDRAFT_693684 [Plicaturopsis crispa FD-325 SS-3]